MIKIFGDYHEIEDEMDRLEDLPNAKTNMLLDTVLKSVEGLVVGQVHIDTDSLRQSAKTDSNERGAKWIGTLTMGGESTGVNNPVDYAIYEKRRGGAHDFFNGIEVFHAAWVAAIKLGLKG